MNLIGEIRQKLVITTSSASVKADCLAHAVAFMLLQIFFDSAGPDVPVSQFFRSVPIGRLRKVIIM